MDALYYIGIDYIWLKFLVLSGLTVLHSDAKKEQMYIYIYISLFNCNNCNLICYLLSSLLFELVVNYRMIVYIVF